MTYYTWTDKLSCDFINLQTKEMILLISVIILFQGLYQCVATNNVGTHNAFVAVVVIKRTKVRYRPPADQTSILIMTKMTPLIPGEHSGGRRASGDFHPGGTETQAALQSGQRREE